jgi:hypothetical protein
VVCFSLFGRWRVEGLFGAGAVEYSRFCGSHFPLLCLESRPWDLGIGGKLGEEGLYLSLRLEGGFNCRI